MVKLLYRAQRVLLKHGQCCLSYSDTRVFASLLLFFPQYIYMFHTPLLIKIFQNKKGREKK